MDTLGLLWGAVVVSARTSEAAGGKLLLQRVRQQLSRSDVVWVDGGYEHRLELWAAEQCGLRVEVVKRSDQHGGWELLPKRWVSERTFAWLGRWRALNREYDYWPAPTEFNIHLAMIHLMLRRLTVR